MNDINKGRTGPRIHNHLLILKEAVVQGLTVLFFNKIKEHLLVYFEDFF